MARPSGCRIETRLDAWRSEALGINVLAKSVETSLDAADTSVRATQVLAYFSAHQSDELIAEDAAKGGERTE